jgi:hypothetical protein
MQREDLRQPHPHSNVEEGLHRRYERHDEDQGDPRAQRISTRQQHRCDTDEQVARRGQRKTDDEGLAPVDQSML